MANNLTPAQQALNAMLQRSFQQLTPQQNATGVNSTSPFMNEFASGFNVGNSIVNAIRTKRDNDRLAKQQADMDNPRNYLPDDYNDYLQWKGQQALAQQALAQQQQQPVVQQPLAQQQSLISQQNPQQNVYSMGKPVVSVGETPQQHGFGSVLSQDNPYPFGVSVNDEGQRVTENGNASPVQANQVVQQNVPQQQIPQQFQQLQQPQQRPYVANNGYTMQGFMRNAMNNGVSPVMSALMYQGIVAPMEEAAREQRMKDSIYTMQTAQENSPEWIKARNQLAVDIMNPDFGFDLQQKRQAVQSARDKLLIDAGFMPQWMENAIGGTDYNNGDTPNNFGVYNMPTQGANIDEQVKQLTPEFQKALPIIGGILKNKFGVNPTISSAARSKERQMQVNPSAPNSYHVYGDAIDIVLPDDTTPEQYKQIENYFKSTGQFAEVLNHDAGSGYHLHLGGYKGGNINSASSQPSQSRWGALRMTPKAMRQAMKDQAEMDYKRALLGLRAEDNAIKKARLAARYGNGSTTRNGKVNIIQREDGSEIALPKLKDMKNEDIYKTIKEYSDKDLNDIKEDKTSVYKVGNAFAKQFQSYLIKFNGDEGQAIRQMAYDLHGNNKKDYSMNSDKLGLAIGSAYVSALGVKDDPARGINTNEVIYNVANYVRDFIDNERWKQNNTNNNTTNNNNNQNQNNNTTQNKKEQKIKNLKNALSKTTKEDGLENKRTKNARKYTDLYNQYLRDEGLLEYEDEDEDE